MPPSLTCPPARELLSPNFPLCTTVSGCAKMSSSSRLPDSSHRVADLNGTKSALPGTAFSSSSLLPCYPRGFRSLRQAGAQICMRMVAGHRQTTIILPICMELGRKVPAPCQQVATTRMATDVASRNQPERKSNSLLTSGVANRGSAASGIYRRAWC